MPNKYFALITGASEGFGKALSLECASRGINLVLVALPGSGLSNLACYIERNYNVAVFYFEHDLSIKEECHQLFLEIEIRKLKINILINNAGIGNTGFFEERNTEFYHRQIELNVVAPTMLAHHFLKTLEENAPAYILNVSSLASFFPLPKKVVYGSTKSYLVSFSRSLNMEMKEKNVFVSTVCPGGMNTTPLLILQNKNQKGVARWSIMNPEEVAKVAIDGMFKKKKVIIPGFWNKLVILLDKLLPKWIKEMITKMAMKRAQPFYNPRIIPINPLKKAI